MIARSDLLLNSDYFHSLTVSYLKLSFSGCCSADSGCSGCSAGSCSADSGCSGCSADSCSDCSADCSAFQSPFSADNEFFANAARRDSVCQDFRNRKHTPLLIVSSRITESNSSQMNYKYSMPQKKLRYTRSFWKNFIFSLPYRDFDS